LNATVESISDRTRDALFGLDRWLSACDLTGWDPYDGLASPLAALTHGRRSRQLVVQTIKRLGPEGRRRLRVPQHRMTKTLALVSAGLKRAPWLPAAAQRRSALSDELRSRRGPAAWGYEFHVQTRWGYYPAYSPNVIVTAFVLEEVSHSLNQSEKNSLIEWFESEMWTGRHFRYVPGNDTFVHNANVLAARALYRIAPDHPYVRRAVALTSAALPEGGLWPYGEERHLAWVDSFHTAYVLDALLDLRESSPAAEKALEQAAQIFDRVCFSDEGVPHYYAGGGGPVDVHNVATSLNLLERLRRSAVLEPRSLRGALNYALGLRGIDGSFRPRPDATAYPRWNDAHMHKALGEVAA
jgi:hypothetical protein